MPTDTTTRKEPAAPAQPLPPRVLRERSVLSYTGLSRSTLGRIVKAGKFPAPIDLTDGTVGWVRSEVDEWVDQRIAESRKQA